MTATAYALVIDSPVGRIGVEMEGDAVSRVDFVDSRTALCAPVSPAARRAARELVQYFSAGRTSFSVALALHGTPFQRRVWRALQGIPAGSTLTYGALAKRLGSGARAVGNACRANPVSLIVPCHRVVASNGLGGFGGQLRGAGLRRKRWLLDHEATVA